MPRLTPKRDDSFSGRFGKRFIDFIHERSSGGDFATFFQSCSRLHPLGKCIFVGPKKRKIPFEVSPKTIKKWYESSGT